MKKLISVFLACIMAVSVLVPSFSAFAVDPKDKNPIVYLRGNGNPIYDAEGNCAYPLNISDEEMQASVKRVVFPYLVNAACSASGMNTMTLLKKRLPINFQELLSTKTATLLTIRASRTQVTRQTAPTWTWIKPTATATPACFHILSGMTGVLIRLRLPTASTNT
ncbi:MAG: hypothetical protein PUB94_07475 [Oscillospiraceae bacterium]|nr:hypothetical protein [Oscillospiraceae bacterium]